MHAARFAEWLSTIFLMMVMTNALDCPSRRGLLRATVKQVASVALGFASSACCQLSGEGYPGCTAGLSSGGSGGGWKQSSGGGAAHWQHRGVSGPEAGGWWLPAALFRASRPHQLSLLLLVGSCWCFADWPLQVWAQWQRRRRARPALGRVATPHAHATQAAVLRAAAAGAWTLFPALFALGALNPAWFPPQAETCAYSVVDLLTKFVYANMLCDANLLSLWAENKARAQLAQKERANEAHRHFLRYPPDRTHVAAPKPTRHFMYSR
jgi:hypothetical protein